ATIEATLHNFLATSRPQDRVLVLFAGHAVEIDGRCYLAPIEGRLHAPVTLIPLEWVYKELEACKARQKLFVVDVCRLEPGRGLERPAAGPLSADLDRALREPPEGVQVWAACARGQRSYELGREGKGGLFLEALAAGAGQGVPGLHEKPAAPFPVALLAGAVNDRLQRHLKPLRLEQTPLLAGRESDLGLAPDPKGPPRAAVAAPPLPGKSADVRLVRAVLDGLLVPPYRTSRGEEVLTPEVLPLFSARALEPYAADEAPAPLRTALERAQVLLWALSSAPPPAALEGAVRKVRGELGTASAALVVQEVRRVPPEGQEARFRTRLIEDARRAAHALRLLEEEIDALKNVA